LVKVFFLGWQKSYYIFWVFAFMVISIIAYIVLVIQVLNVYIERLTSFNYTFAKYILYCLVIVQLVYL
jgi:hypothetical protein